MGIWLFLISHWQLSFFYLQTSIQLLLNSKFKCNKIPKLAFNAVNALFTVTITVIIIVAAVGMKRTCNNTKPETSEI